MKRLHPACAMLVATLAAGAAQAVTVEVTVDTTKSWLSYATVFELPASPAEDRGAFVYGQFYHPGFYATPPGTIAGHLAELRPNTSLAPSETDTAHPYHGDWWKDDGAGGVAPNKIIQDGFYIQDDSLAGSEIVFTGVTVSNSLAMPYGASARAFIVETSGPEYSFVDVWYTPLAAGQPFRVQASVAAGHHVAYGIELVGPNARASELAGLGVLQVSAIPEPATAVLFSMGMLGWLLRRRRL